MSIAIRAGDSHALVEEDPVSAWITSADGTAHVPVLNDSWSCALGAVAEALEMLVGCPVDSESCRSCARRGVGFVVGSDPLNESGPDCVVWTPTGVIVRSDYTVVLVCGECYENAD